MSEQPNSEHEESGSLERLRNEMLSIIEQKDQATKQALLAQEHRLIPALANLLRTLFLLEGPDRKEKIVPSATAVFWCLVPSAATASIGIVAVLSLLVAWQQARLLATQNDKIETQNILAEAQRRSALVFETTAVLDLIQREKDNLNSTKERRSSSICSDAEKSFSCWTGPASGQGRFVPSQATVGRLAALTRALRPYRYLNVEDSFPYRFIGQSNNTDTCAEDITSPTIGFAEQTLTSAAYQIQPDDSKLKDLPTLRSVLLEKYKNSDISDIRLRTRISKLADEYTNLTSEAFGLGSRGTMNAQMNCAPSSPERGQLLISLHAAQMDISRVADAGGDFRYSDVPGAQLNGIHLKNVDLSFSRLPGASFSDAHLDGVKLDHIHLAGVSFRRAVIRSTSFDGSILQRFNDGAASVSLFAAAVVADNVLNGTRFIEIQKTDGLFERICMAGSMYARLDSKTMRLASTPRLLPMMTELRRFALLVETSTSTIEEKAGHVIGVIIPKSLNTRQTLISASFNKGYSTSLEYFPFDTCEGWPPEASTVTSK